MKTLRGEAISHLILSNTLDMFHHLEMEHSLVLFVAAPLLKLRVQSGLCTLTVCKLGSCVWFHIHYILQILDVGGL